MWSLRNFCQILVEIEISRQIFEKFPNIKFHENPSSGSRVLCGRTDRQSQTEEHDEGNSRFLQFRERT